MDHGDVASWEGFAVAIVGAAAVLAGLVFLAVTINVERILPVRGLPGRAGESVIFFLGALCESAYVLIPHQPVPVAAQRPGARLRRRRQPAPGNSTIYSP